MWICVFSQTGREWRVTAQRCQAETLKNRPCPWSETLWTLSHHRSVRRALQTQRHAERSWREAREGSLQTFYCTRIHCSPRGEETRTRRETETETERGDCPKPNHTEAVFVLWHWHMFLHNMTCFYKALFPPNTRRCGLSPHYSWTTARSTVVVVKCLTIGPECCSSCPDCAGRFEHITSELASLHWFPVQVTADSYSSPTKP